MCVILISWWLSNLTSSLYLQIYTNQPDEPTEITIDNIEEIPLSHPCDWLVWMNIEVSSYKIEHNL